MNNLYTNETFNKATEAGRRAADESTRAARGVIGEASQAGEQIFRASADAARQGAHTAQEAMTAGLNTATQTFQQVADQFTRSLGFAEPKAQELARKSSQNLEAVTQTSTVLAQGVQEISREWFSLAQDQMKRNMSALNALTGCRSVQDFVAVQSDLVRDNVQQVINNSRRLSEISARIAQDATRTIQAQSNDTASVRSHRAA